MYKSKLSPEQALETIKLRMKYDSSKTLTENVDIVNEQGLAGNPMTGQASGGQTYGGTSNTSGTKWYDVIEKWANRNSKKFKARDEQFWYYSNNPTGLTDVKAFQDWLNKNKPGWAAGYTGGIVTPKSKGYGTYGPRTKKAWETYKDEFLKDSPTTPTPTPTPAKSEEEEAEAVYGDNPSDIIASN